MILHNEMEREIICSSIHCVCVFFFLGKRLQPVLHQTVYHGIFTVLLYSTSLSGLTVLFVAMLPYSYNCVNVEVVMEPGRVLIDLAACGRWF